MTKAYIGMGGNVASLAGEPEQTLAAALARISALGQLHRRSRLYRTEPVGGIAQPKFVNAVVELETTLTPRALLDGLMLIEKAFGRNRVLEARFGPRTLDLDIEFYGDLVVGADGLEIPHPRLSERAFVLRPLVEIAPDLVEPRTGKSVARLLATLESGGLPVEAAVAFDSPFWNLDATAGDG